MDVELFSYSKRTFWINSMLFALLMAATIISVLIIGAGAFYASIVLIIEGAMLLILGISPLLTDHSIEGGKLVLRQGWYFQAEVSLNDIKSVSRVDRGPFRTGVFYKTSSSTIYITSRRTDLIELKLNRKNTFRSVLGKKADTILFDAERTGDLMTILIAGTSLPPVRTDGARAKLGD